MWLPAMQYSQLSGPRLASKRLAGRLDGWEKQMDMLAVLKCSLPKKQNLKRKLRKHGRRQQIVCLDSKNMVVSKNRDTDTPKWTVYNGKPY